MALLVTILLIFLYPFVSNAGPPAPGYNPSSKVPTIAFDQGYSNLWGPQHQKEEQGTLSIWLDKSSGSGYKSKTSYRSGYFSTNVKLQTGYTAGVITCFYLSNDQEYPGYHDEIDIEFLGTTLDKPYVLQTNVYMKGTGDGNNTVGREMQFHLWFDPTQDYHNYAILWNPDEIIWYVDDVPIRWYQKKSDDTFPQRPMWTYGSIWDASDWATEGGKYKCDYKYQPFIGLYNNFRIGACKASAPESCNPPPGSPNQTGGLSQQQATAMAWVQKNNMVYNYCKDPSRDHSKTPEC